MQNYYQYHSLTQPSPGDVVHQMPFYMSPRVLLACRLAVCNVNKKQTTKHNSISTPSQWK